MANLGIVFNTNSKHFNALKKYTSQFNRLASLEDIIDCTLSGFQWSCLKSGDPPWITTNSRMYLGFDGEKYRTVILHGNGPSHSKAYYGSIKQRDFEEVLDGKYGETYSIDYRKVWESSIKKDPDIFALNYLGHKALEDQGFVETLSAIFGKRAEEFLRYLISDKNRNRENDRIARVKRGSKSNMNPSVLNCPFFYLPFHYEIKNERRGFEEGFEEPLKRLWQRGKAGANFIGFWPGKFEVKYSSWATGIPPEKYTPIHITSAWFKEGGHEVLGICEKGELENVRYEKSS